MPEHTLYVAPASAPCRAVLFHHHCIGAVAPEIEIRTVDLMAGDHKSAAFLRRNPSHCVPTLLTPWGPLWESRAIMRYFESIIPEPRMYPTNVYHRAVVDRLLDWDLGSLYRTISSIVYPQAFHGEEPKDEDLQKLDERTRFLDQAQLGDGRSFLTGEALTIADISVAATLSLLRLIDLEVDDVENLAAWQQRIAGLPGYAAFDAPFQQWIKSMRGKDPGQDESDGDSESESERDSGSAEKPGDAA